MVSRLSLLALTGTLMLAGGQAHAKKLAQRAAVVTPLGAWASALTYWIDELEGFRVVTTVDTVHPGEGGGEDSHAIVRVSTILRLGSTPPCRTRCGFAGCIAYMMSWDNFIAI